ncbi:MAG: exo-beta-N-acetylmuramidase NamZ domain-containing protein, partial [Saprospiraceae bacterium]
MCLIPVLQFRCAEQLGEAQKHPARETAVGAATDPILPGAYRMERYLSLLEGKKVGLLVNQTSLVGTQHLIDTLLWSGVEVVRIFSPEHGYRGTASDGEKVADGRDAATGIPVISLYGKKRKPDTASMEGLDLVVFDVQDVGARFYTYTATLSLLMEACAEHHLPVLVLDRPNPNGHYVDGPMLRESQKSFIGPHPVPVVYGMTIGELALMFRAEKKL